MAGVAGKSGGPRKNSGGARAGAGRKPKPKAETVPLADMDMLTLLQEVALGRIEASAGQIRAAIAAVQYTHIKKGDGGVKDAKGDAAKKAGSGKFAASAPPGLRAVK
jgi:phage terminase small subunit